MFIVERQTGPRGMEDSVNSYWLLNGPTFVRQIANVHQIYSFISVSFLSKIAAYII